MVLCFFFIQLGSDSENEGEPGTESEPVFSSQSLLISHPTRKCVFEFLRVIMTDSLTSNTTPKSLGVIDTISELSRNLFSLKLFGKPLCEIIALNSSTHFTSYYKFLNLMVNCRIFE